MLRASLTLSLLLLTPSWVQAQSATEDAFAVMMDHINKTGIMTMETGAQSYDPASDTLTVHDVRYSFGWNWEPKGKDSQDTKVVLSGQITYPTITYRDMKYLDGGISFAEITTHDGTFDLSFDLAEEENDASLTGKEAGETKITNGFVPLPKPFSLDPERPITGVLDYLRPYIWQTRYESYTSDGMEFVTHPGGGEVNQTARYGPMRLSGLEKGKIDRFELDSQRSFFTPAKDMPQDNSVKDAGGKDRPKPSSVWGEENNGVKAFEDALETAGSQVGKTVYEGYDFGALFAVLDPQSPPLSGTRSFLERATVDSISFKAGDILSFGTGPYIQENITLTQPDSYMLPILETSFKETRNGQPLSAETIKALTNSGLDLLRAISMEKSSLSNLTFDMSVPESQNGGQTVHLTLDEMTFNGVSKEGIEELSATGFTMKSNTPTPIMVALDRYAIEDVEFASIKHLKRVINANIEGGSPTPEDVAKLTPLAATLSVQGLLYEDGAGQSVKAKSIRATHRTDGLTFPAHLALKTEGLEVSKSLIGNPLLSVLLTQLGTETLKLDEELVLDWNKDTEELILDPLSINIGSLAKLVGKIGFGGVKRDYLDNPQMIEAAMATSTVLPSHLTLTDNGGLPALINLAGATTNMGPEQVRMFAQSQVQAMLSTVTTPEFARLVSEQVKTFLADPKSLHLALSPAAPVPVMQIIGAATTAPQTVPEILNIGVVANDL